MRSAESRLAPILTPTIPLLRAASRASTASQHRVCYLAVLVEAGRQPDRVGKGEAERAHREKRIVGGGAQRQELERPDRKAVTLLRVGEPQQWPADAIDEADHPASSGN